jgi:hypothetical protein
MISKCKIMHEVYPNIDPGTFYRICNKSVRAELQKWSPAKLGELTCYGRGFGYTSEKPVREQNSRTELYRMGNVEWLDKQQSGHTLLETLATMTMVAAMYDLVLQRQDEEREAEEEFDQGMRDYTHNGPNRGRPLRT